MLHKSDDTTQLSVLDTRIDSFNNFARQQNLDRKKVAKQNKSADKFCIHFLSSKVFDIRNAYSGQNRQKIPTLQNVLFCWKNKRKEKERQQRKHIEFLSC